MHIQKNEFEAFENNLMNTDEMIAFLEHLDNCNYCLEEMSDHIGDTSCTPAPAYLKNQILTRAAAPDVQTARAASVTSYKVQLFYYSLRTVAGIIGALFVLFGVCQLDFSPTYTNYEGKTQMSQTIHTEQPEENHLYHFSKKVSRNLSDSSQKITDYLSDLSNKIVNGGE